MIFILISTLPVSRQKTLWVTCRFTVGPREMRPYVIVFVFFVTSG